MDGSPVRIGFQATDWMPIVGNEYPTSRSQVKAATQLADLPCILPTGREHLGGPQPHPRKEICLLGEALPHEVILPASRRPVGKQQHTSGREAFLGFSVRVFPFTLPQDGPTIRRSRASIAYLPNRTQTTAILTTHRLLSSRVSTFPSNVCE
jgi:hypothetical protein